MSTSEKASTKRIPHIEQVLVGSIVHYQFQANEGKHFGE